MAGAAGFAASPAFGRQTASGATPSLHGENGTFRPDRLKATLSTVASFPKLYFLENLVARRDNSLLVTVFNQGELWYVPPSDGTAEVKPMLVHTFADQPPLNLVEVEPDLFYVHTSNAWSTHECALDRLDLRGWSPGQHVHPQRVLDFPKQARALNGSCLLTPRVMLIADSIAGLIWRVDLAADGMSAVPRVWLASDNMAFEPDNSMAKQPGVNAVRYAERTGYVYYTSTNERLFMRVRVDPTTHEPAGAPEFVSGGRMADDFLIDEERNVAYLTTHIQNTIDVVSLDPELDRDIVHHVVAGDPFNDQLVGPSSGVWSRRPGEYGRVGYFTTDGGTKKPPPDGTRRRAKLVRLDLQWT